MSVAAIPALSPALAGMLTRAHQQIARTVSASVRLSWVTDLYDEGGNSEFSDLLRTLSPRTWRRLRKPTRAKCYSALLGYLAANCFPVWDTDVWETDDEDGEEFGYYPGIPFEVQGFDPDEEVIASPAFAWCWMAANFTDLNMDTPYFDCLKPWQAVIASMLPAGALHRVDAGRLPAGRVWQKPWEGLRDMYLWVSGQTDNAFLDLSSLAQQEMNAYPPWNLEEIDALRAGWREAKAVIARAQKLQQHIDSQAAKRLPLLAGALRGDPASLERITTPARVRVRV